MKESRRKVESILGYLAGFEKACWQRREQEHFQECYRLVHGCFYGKYTLPQVPMIAVPVSELPAPTVRPAWHIEKYSHPLRKIVKTTRVDGSPLWVHYELSCGHVVKDLSPISDSPDSHVACRRRCKQCKPEPGKQKRTA